MQTGIEVDTPSCAPACGAVTSNLQRLMGSLVNILYTVHSIGKAVTRINAKEVTLMTMMRVFVVPIIEPLLEVTLLTYLIGLQARERLISLSNKILVQTQHKGCITGIRQTLTNHGQVGRAAIETTSVVTLRCHVVVLGRGTRACKQIIGSLRLNTESGGRNQPTQTELGSALQDRIVFLQELLIERKGIMFPYMCADPCSTHVPVGPLGITGMQAHRAGHSPNIGIMCQTPSSVHTIICLGCKFARALQLLHKGEQRLVHLGHSGGLGRPVILLQVDIGSIVAGPRGKDALVPQTLQVGRNVGSA